MKKMLFLLLIIVFSGTAVAQEICRSELIQNTANLTSRANYIELRKSDPVMVALMEDVYDAKFVGDWKNVPGYQVRSPGAAMWVDMDLSRGRNQTYDYLGEKGTFLVETNFGHWIVTRLSDGFEAPAGCGNPIKRKVPFTVTDNCEGTLITGYEYQNPNNQNQDNQLFYESGNKDFDNGIRYTPAELGTPTVSRTQPVVMTGNLAVDAKNIPVETTKYRTQYILNSCQTMWAQKYPEAYRLWQQTDSRTAFNERTIPYGPDRRKARRCFEGPSVARVGAFILGGAALSTGAYYGIDALANGGDDPFDPNTPEDEDPGPGDYNPGDDVGLIFNLNQNSSNFGGSSFGNLHYNSSPGGIRISLFGGG
ncbi:hypothetical protein CL684_00265 [Candidatus Campbellbacteria bacterium]|nr:hypothetical protein [Candidatus Campbellbacteria bacterium]|tara:strand:+ start:2759 stop:3853 length:1095 start_codon:yes stop_codon:yes gene_type:complete